MNKRLKQIILLFIAQLLIFNCTPDDLKNFDTFKVKKCTPANNEYGVDEDTVITVKFNNAADRKTIEEDFTLSSGSETVKGHFEWTADDTFIFTPEEQLSISTRYVIELSRTVRDEDGNTMEMDFLSDFYVGGDMEAPYVTGSNPVYTNGGTTIAPPLDTVTINFSEAMDVFSTEQAFNISPSLAGYFTWPDASTIVYNITDQIEYGTHYKITVSESAEDIIGNTLQDAYTITIIPGDDFIPPEVAGISDGVAAYWLTSQLNIISKTNTDIVVEFSKPMDRNSAQNAFSISPSITGSFSWDTDSIMTFTPDEGSMVTETIYNISIDNSAKDTNGMKLADSYELDLKTGSGDSSYISVRTISGSNDGGTFTLLDLAVYPVVTDMGTAVGSSDVDSDYYFQIVFERPDNMGVPQIVEMDFNSLVDNISIEKIAGKDFLPKVLDFSISTNLQTLTYALNNLTNKTLPAPDDLRNLYRITISGGENGVKDTDGNFMQDDFVFDFQEAP